MVAKPLSGTGYQQTNTWFYRCYNGQLYGTGKQGSNRRKIHPNDTVTCTLNFGSRELMFRVNEEDQRVCFRGFSASEVYPAVNFYSSNRTVCRHHHPHHHPSPPLSPLA